MMRLRVALLGILISGATLAQPPPDQPPLIKVDVDVVNILCSVRDKKGGFVTRLSKDDFILSEDGKPQTIKYFARETDLPLTLGLLVDVSGSQRNLIDIERNAASQFFAQVIHKNDMAFLISFGEDAELLQDYTNSTRLLRAALDNLRVNSGVSGLHPGPVPTISQPRGTVLFDAVYLASTEKFKGEVGRKAIVLITDGVDQGSRLKLSDALAASQKSDAIIYGIYYVDPGAYGGRGGFFYRPSDSDLRKMSEETGGRVFRADRKNSLQDIFNRLQEELRSQYALGYTPTNEAKDGSFRRVEIRLSNKDLKAQARKGYFALPPGSR